MEIGDFIKKSLINYDKQQNKYKDYVNRSDDILTNKIKEVESYEVLGIYHEKTQVFIWGWVPSDLPLEKTKIARELLNYGLNLDPQSNAKEHFLLKTLLINSRNYISSDFDLELLLALSSNILKNKSSFILSHDITSKDNEVIIRTYYLVKISNK